MEGGTTNAGAVHFTRSQMKVYRVTFQQALLPRQEDLSVFEGDTFSGIPFPSEWKRIELLPANKSIQTMDFYAVGEKAFVCSAQVHLYSGALWDEGEFLPVKISGLRGKYYLYNITNCRSHLDPRKTVWQKNGQTGHKAIKLPAFHANRLGEDCVFKIPEDGATTIYTLERDDVPGHEGLKTFARRHQLTGLRFKLVWSNETK